MRRSRVDRLDRAATLTLVIVAVVMLAMNIVRSSAPAGVRTTETVPEDWRDETKTGIVMGPEGAELTIVEFIDFECPFCAAWSLRVDSLLEAAPGRVQVSLHHFPLPQHAHALAAAIAVECANAQGRFVEYQRVLFAQQSQFGAKTWAEFASEAGIPDLVEFERCSALPSDSFPRIAYGQSLGERVGVRGTPTVWVNGEAGQRSLKELLTIAGR